MESEIKKTLLHEWHVKQGANMAQFGGYDMPLWYPTGAKSEHLAVLDSAGLFDTSHMASVMLSGPDAFALLQVCFSKNLDACIGQKALPLSPGRSVYGVFLNDAGEVIDDAIVFRIETELYMIVVNAGMGKNVSAHLLTHAESLNVEITDLSDNLGKLDVQGPQSARILSKIIKDPEAVFTDLPYFAFKGHFDGDVPAADAVRLTDGTPLLLSRTGYTGEFGFEIFVQPDRFVSAWQAILDAGSDFQLMVCGLAARDSLRAGAVLPLSHQDIGSWPFINHPWRFALPYTDDQTGFTKAFIGSSALLDTNYQQYTLPFAGYDLRKVSTHDPAVVVDEKENPIGSVLTCATDMGIGRHEDRIYSIASPDKPESFKPRGMCCGFIKSGIPLSTGQTVILKDNRRKIKVEIVDDVRPHRTARAPISNFL